MFGIENESDKLQCQEDDTICERSGSEKLGSTDLVSNMGAMLLLAFVLIFIALLMVILYFMSKKCGRQCYETLKKKLLYNPFLRYVLQSSLKLQMASCAVIFFD